MGGSNDWIKQEQAVQQAYYDLDAIPSVQKEECQNLFEGIKVDGIDKAYIWARTFIPSWVMGVVILVGVVTLIPSLLRKFGLNVRFNIERKGK